MKKRYIVCLNASNKEQDQLFIKYTKDNGLGWWHWLPNVWFIIDKNGKLKASDIRDAVRQSFQDEYNIVVEINSTGDSWSGFGPTSEESNMFKWIHDHWKKE